MKKRHRKEEGRGEASSREIFSVHHGKEFFPIPPSTHSGARVPGMVLLNCQNFFFFSPKDLSYLNLIPSLVLTKDVVNASSYALLQLHWNARGGQKISILIPIDTVPEFATFTRLWEAKDVVHAVFSLPTT